MNDPLPTLRVRTAREAVTLATLATLPAESLARWLAERRWFGAKGGVPRRVRFARVVPLPWSQGRFAIAEVVTEGELGRARWQLPLAVQSSTRGLGEAVAPIAAVTIDEPRAEGWLVDATTDPEFIRLLAGAFALTIEPGVYGLSVTGDDATFSVETLGHEAFVVPHGASVRLLEAEQSNTSILVGEVAILKLFRRLEAGEHPDVEVTHFLTIEAAFPNTPTLLGRIRLTKEGGESGPEAGTVLGMLQEYLPASVDAWRWTLEVARGGDVSRYLPAAERLGAVTRALHEALASAPARRHPAFAPEPVTADEVQRWAERTKEQMTDALDLLERQRDSGSLPAELIATSDRLLRSREEQLARADALAGTVASDAGLLVRTHGDYHLGQVLRTAGGDFMVIDFEGEPSRSIAERRRKQSALRDVAGMLRSFAYAAATVFAEAGEGRAEAIAHWESAARDAFLRGYLRTPVTMEGNAVQGHLVGDEGGAHFLPRAAEDVERLTTLFELEKVYYELAYELNNRPEWTWIPLQGIARLAAP